jgi:hypothetical protein
MIENTIENLIKSGMKNLTSLKPMKAPTGSLFTQDCLMKVT